MYKSPTLTEQLEIIQKDIIAVLLLNSKPMSQAELHCWSELSLSEFGWSFALEKLEKKRVIKFVGPKYWELVDRDKMLSELSIEEFQAIYIDHIKILQPDRNYTRYERLFGVIQP